MAIAPHSSLSPTACGSGSGSGSGFGANAGSSPKPDWTNTYYPPPPNRLQDLELTREASLGRKIEGAALAEELVLSWLRQQAQDTLPSQINLTELNRATRILYRLTAIQKTLMGLHAEICGKKGDKNPAPPDNTPDDPELTRELADDSDGSDDDDTSSPPPLSSGVPLSGGTSSSLANGQAASPDAPSHASDIEHLTSEPSHTSHTSHPSHPSHVPQSAIPIPHSSPRAASVHACPTIPGLDEDYLDQTLAMVSRLTGKPVRVLASSTENASEPPESEPSAAAPNPDNAPSHSPSPSNSSDQSVGSVQFVRSVESDLPQSEISNLKSEIPNPQSLSVHPSLPLSHGPPRFQF